MITIALLAAVAATPSAQSPIRVFDVHMHAPLPRDNAEWSSAMDELGVDRAVLIGVPAQLAAPPPEAGNRFIPSLMFPCEKGRAVNVGFQCFADGREFPDLVQLRALVAEGKVRALGEINAQYLGIAPDDPRLEPYYALAEELNLPVGIHLGIGPPGVAYSGKGFPPVKSPNYSGVEGSPLRLEKVLLRHPKLKLYVMHAAWPFADELKYMLYMHPRLHADLSVLQWAIPRPAYYAYLRELVEAGFGKRLMFGSDGGVKHLRAGVAAIRDADFLTAEQKHDILHDNAARFFADAPATP